MSNNGKLNNLQSALIGAIITFFVAYFAVVLVGLDEFGVPFRVVTALVISFAIFLKILKV